MFSQHVRSWSGEAGYLRLLRCGLYHLAAILAARHMITWLQTIDAALFRVVNQSLTNPVFDWLMPKLGGHQLFVATLLAVVISLLCKGGRRGRLLVLFLVLGIALTDGLACSAIKKVVDRPRPASR